MSLIRLGVQKIPVTGERKPLIRAAEVGVQWDHLNLRAECRRRGVLEGGGVDPQDIDVIEHSAEHQAPGKELSSHIRMGRRKRRSQSVAGAVGVWRRGFKLNGEKLPAHVCLHSAEETKGRRHKLVLPFKPGASLLSLV